VKYIGNTTIRKIKIPKEVENEIQLKYSVRGNSFTLLESRPKWDDNSEWVDTYS